MNVHFVKGSVSIPVTEETLTISERFVGSVGECLLIEKRKYLGFPYIVWKKPMPRLNDRILFIVVYLYPSKDDAERGTKVGGTGFIARLRTQEGWHDYVITNRHNVDGQSFPAASWVRINTHDKKKPVDCFEGDWSWSETDDIAACELPFHRAYYRYDHIDTVFFLTEDQVSDLRVGLGDDLFMVGRFINHDGTEKNIPVVRFGTIAMMPQEPIIADGKPQESFLIEIRTIPGFSGSPVFIRMEAESRYKDQQFKPNLTDKQMLDNWGHLEKLLGIEWCRVKGETAIAPLINGSPFDIQVPTGMSGCIPAWRILDFLKTIETR